MMSIAKPGRMSKQQLPIERLHPGWVLALVAFCLVVFSVQLSYISGAMPYSSHIDEGATLDTINTR